MQVKCTKCSQPIALTDTIESDNGRLLHVDCKRPQGLTPAEQALVIVYCSGHVVAQCPACDGSLSSTELGVDIVGGSRMNMCPRCRRDLTDAVRAHLFRCAMLPSEVQRRAQAAREAAGHLVKESQQLRDRSDVLIREAEAALLEKQRALRESMSRSAAIRDPRLTALQGIHVLLIDDDRHGRHYFRSLLELWGAIVTATSTADAIRVALIADVIVCDLISAEHARGEFLEWLRHMHVRDGRRVPAVALVPAGVRKARVRAPGFQRYLTKPVDADDLRTAVSELARS